MNPNMQCISHTIAFLKIHERTETYYLFIYLLNNMNLKKKKGSVAQHSPMDVTRYLSNYTVTAQLLRIRNKQAIRCRKEICYLFLEST